MLRMTVTTLPDRTTVLLEGRLAGAWVDELTACWRDVIAMRDSRAIQIDLEGVTFVDSAGKTLLRAMHGQGAILLATEVMARTIVDEAAPDTGPAEAFGRAEARDNASTGQRMKGNAERK
jgi:anti-anti-sigma regulatory factor